MAAFSRAVELGYRYLETDVHVTGDGVLVAFHDDRLDRVTDRQGLIADLTWDEVSKARIGGTEAIPLFDDVLTTWPSIRVNVDPKSDAAVAPLIETLRGHEAIDRVCVGSFSDARIAACRDALGPRLCTSPGPRDLAKVVARMFHAPVPLPPVACLQVPTSHRGVPLVTRKFVQRAHQLGLQVHVWTINDQPEMERLLNLGVDAIMTDELALLKKVLVDRGQSL